jgi:PTH1 family peptidyl-tRNA hydrolase
LDLSFGRIKIKEKGGNGGHKGIQSIMSCVGGGNFTRVRIGIGRPFEGIEATEYVVQPFDESQRYALDEVMVRAQAALETLLRSGIHAAMNQCNRKK